MSSGIGDRDDAPASDHATPDANVGPPPPGPPDPESGPGGQSRRGALVLSTAILVVVALYLLQTLDFRPEARVMPRVVGVPLFVLAAIQVVSDLRAVLDERRTGTQPDAPTRRTRNRTEVTALGLVVLYGVAFLLVGFVIASPVFMLLYLRYYGKHGWVLSVGITLGTMLVVYYAFSVVLGVPVFRGLLPRMLL